MLYLIYHIHIHIITYYIYIIYDIETCFSISTSFSTNNNFLNTHYKQARSIATGAISQRHAPAALPLPAPHLRVRKSKVQRHDDAPEAPGVDHARDRQRALHLLQERERRLYRGPAEASREGGQADRGNGGDARDIAPRLRMSAHAGHRPHPCENPRDEASNGCGARAVLRLLIHASMPPLSR